MKVGNGTRLWVVPGCEWYEVVDETTQSHIIHTYDNNDINSGP